jgi:hypothetical protein
MAARAAQFGNGVSQALVHGQRGQPLWGHGCQRIAQRLHVVRGLFQRRFALAPIIVRAIIGGPGAIHVVTLIVHLEVHPPRRGHGLSGLTALRLGLSAPEGGQGSGGIQGF